MTEDFLTMIKQKAYDELKQNKLYNKKVDRVNKLLQYKCILEYFSLVEEEPTRLQYRNVSFDDIVSRIFNREVYKIKDTETNHIYVYRGTYLLDHFCDIEHGPTGIVVGRNDPSAQYRTYHDLEQYFEVDIPINKCDEFEQNNYILFVGISRYYEIQKEFIVDAIKYNQDVAVKNILKKYSKKK